MAAERDERMAKRRIDVSPFITLACQFSARERKISATLGLVGDRNKAAHRARWATVGLSSKFGQVRP